MEIPLAEMLGTSRTPVRLALSVLQQERLVVASGPRRGFVVNSFTLGEVFDAIGTRGTLEGMAARCAAERGLRPDYAQILHECVEQGSALLKDLDNERWGEAWIENNAAFHATLVAASGNRAIQIALEPLNRMPLASPSAVVLRTNDHARDLHRLRRAQDDHRDILEAIEAGQGSRAETLLREHAALNIRNKRLNFVEIKARKAAGNLPGLDLVDEVATPPRPERRRRRTAIAGTH
jgi:GntR family transcriptional regulator of vanillate catabolism